MIFNFDAINELRNDDILSDELYSKWYKEIGSDLLKAMKANLSTKELADVVYDSVQKTKKFVDNLKNFTSEQKIILKVLLLEIILRNFTPNKNNYSELIQIFNRYNIPIDIADILAELMIRNNKEGVYS